MPALRVNPLPVKISLCTHPSQAGEGWVEALSLSGRLGLVPEAYLTAVDSSLLTGVAAADEVATAEAEEAVAEKEAAVEAHGAKGKAAEATSAVEEYEDEFDADDTEDSAMLPKHAPATQRASTRAQVSPPPVSQPPGAPPPYRYI